MAAAASASGAPQASIGMRDEWLKPEVREKLRGEFVANGPYKHGVVRPFLGREALEACRADVEKLEATEKETDLFRFFQTEDIAPRFEEGADGQKRRKLEDGAKEGAATPALSALAELFGSEAFRKLCQDVTGCGELTDRVDLSAQIYPQGGHLLCHDDVIGTRKVSFIYYLTDPEEEWTSAEGGALELYPADAKGPAGTPAVVPAKEILPLSDSLALFVVEPGESFHAVREVRGERARISIQGWLHAPSVDAAAGEKQKLATLQQLLKAPGQQSAELLPAMNGESDLTKEDCDFLSQWLAPEYLDAAQLKGVSERFTDASYALLGQFLKPELYAKLTALLAETDQADGFAEGCEELPVPDYNAGVGDGWEAVGPPHLRRYLRYAGGGAEAKGRAGLGSGLKELSEKLFGSQAFRRWLKAATGLDPRSAGGAEVRRFRPGLDYTVAAQADHVAPGFADLDVTLLVVPPGTEEQWGSEDVGGFDSYLAADDDKHETVEAQEVYRGSEDEGPLVNVTAMPNSLALVMRDSKTLRFVKYLSRSAPSSRVDVAACYPVEAPEDASSEEEEDDEAEPQEAAASSA